MSAETLNVTKRDKLGTANNRRLRYTGKVPAVLYGHGEASISLTVASEEIWAAVKHGGKLVNLKGDVTESALIRAVQWDVWSKEIIHIDLMRVSASEKVSTTIAVELKGTAAGLTEGGVLQFITHELEILCPAAEIPEKLIVNVNNLHLGKAIHANEVTLPKDGELVTPGSVVVVSCVAPKAASDDDAAAGSAEPEVIGKKDKADEAAE
ncbi:ribosomal 5S rRNA E-loop binding protein Ctc/L25/TL5 [Pirellula staleyi DSM 6068]|uniref:Large ribosomal subunit protein bL25 n=1 Tax=Pirellula staleyi (strain ATCC 27377 / DSM 6068 / ICPB 4128) TaxID=530564 RepID=D2R6P0_PIRSD|nr:50S ribosomal protein L25 [Pirellula staleyi]ADB17340.1 ribosomal 5S rRNA E-loop binding protein Ctc/L25/TL5 [Pirellula staleyi DSM 6068]